MKIDILMATYNGEKYLKEQLDSILNQTYKDFRLLISDDASKDSTIKILEEYAKKDNRIVLFKQKENLGIIRNFEFLMKNVKSEFFMFSDQDDIWNEAKIEKSLNKIEETNSDLVYADLEVVDEKMNTLSNSYWKLKEFEHKIYKHNNFESLYLNNYITGSTMIIRKKMLDKILPIFYESKYILHDYWVALVVSKLGKISYIDEPLVKYRQHKNNEIGSRKKSDKINDFNELRNLFIDVKIDHFNTLKKRQDVFNDEKINALNEKSLKYYEKLKNVKIITFKNIGLFIKLYKYEKFGYSIQNFVILSMPGIAKVLFKIKKGFKK